MKIKQLFVLLLTSVWMVFLVKALVLNDWGTGFSFLLWDRLQSLFQFVACIFICGLLGSKILSFLRWNDDKKRLSYSIGIGLGLWCLYILGIGLLRKLNVESLTIFFSFILLFCWREGYSIAQNIRESIRNFSNSGSTDVYSKILYAVLFFSLILLAIGAFGPVVDYDSLEYHVALADLYAKTGAVTSLPHHMFSHFPLNVEMLYAASLVLGKLEFIKYFNFLFVILTGLLVYQYSREHWGRKAGLLASVLLLCSIHLADTAWTGKSDVGLLFFSTASMILFFEGGWRKYLLSGLFAGLALGTKHTAILYVWGGLGAVWICNFFSHKEKGLAFKNSLIFIFVSSMIALPWWFRSFIQTGDPIFPFGFPFFKSSLWTLDLYQRLTTHYHTLSLNLKSHAWSAPFYMIEKGSCFRPMAYVGLPFILMKLKDKRIQNLFFYVLIGYVLGFFKTTGDARFLLPVFPALAIAVSVSLLHEPISLFLKKITGCVLGVFALWNIASMAIFLENSNIPRYFWGLTSLHEYLIEKLPHYSSIHFLNRIMQPTEKVLFIGEARTFYLREEALASTPFDLPEIVSFLEGARDNDEILKRFRLKKVHYILINPREILRLDRSFPGWRDKMDTASLKNFIDHFAKLIFQDSKTGIEIYHIRNEKD